MKSRVSPPSKNREICVSSTALRKALYVEGESCSAYVGMRTLGLKYELDGLIPMF